MDCRHCGSLTHIIENCPYSQAVCRGCEAKDKIIDKLRLRYELSAEEILARKRKQGREAQKRYKEKRA